MSTDFHTALERELVEAARRRRRLRVARLPLRRPDGLAVTALTAAAVALAIAFVVVVRPGADARHAATAGLGPAPAATADLSVLRRATVGDLHAANRALRRIQGELALEAPGVRVLHVDPDGRAYTLLSVRGFPARGRTVQHGLCLSIDTIEGGGYRCWSLAALLAGDVHWAVSTWTFGIVPDGVAYVRAAHGGALQPVRDNFYKFERPPGDFGAPAWFDADRRPVTRTTSGDRVMGPSLVPLPPGLPATLPYAGGQRPAALRLADLPHAPTVIAFTASWCTPCRKQTAELDRLRRRGVAVLQVGFEDKAADLARAPGPPLRVTDPGGKLATAFGVRAIPATIALDASKRILARRVGPVDAAWTDDYLAAVLPRQRDLLQALTP